MNGSILGKLTLTEQRILTGIGGILFLLINVTYVWPQIGRLQAINEQLGELRRKLNEFQIEVTNSSIYQQKLLEFQNKGLQVLPEERSLTLMRIVQDLARSCQLNITAITPVPAPQTVRTNLFYDEEILRVSFDAQPEALVSFFHSLGSEYPMIQARTVEIQPSPRRYSLQGYFHVVASYRKIPSKQRPAITNSSSTNRTEL